VVEVAADQQQNFCRGVGNLRLVTGDGAGEDVVDHNGRDRSDQTQCSGQQCFGDTRGHNGKVGGLGFGDADEAVHDAPHGTEQADERRGGTDGGEHAGAAAHVATAGGNQTLKAEADALLDAFFFAAVDRQAHLFERVVYQQVGEGAFLAGGGAGFFKGGGFFQGSDFATQTTLGAHQLEAFGDPDGPGDDRGDGQADHHDFDDNVGVLVHAPRRQVVGHAQRVVGFENFRNVGRRLPLALGRWQQAQRQVRSAAGACCSARPVQVQLSVGERGGRCQHQAEQQSRHRAPGARSFGWRSGDLITCHAGRT
jgi:hypothetical protein